MAKRVRNLVLIIPDWNRQVQASRHTCPVRLVLRHESGDETLTNVTRVAFRLLLIERYIYPVTYVGILTGVGNSVRIERRSIERNRSRIEETNVGRQFAVGCEHKLEYISHIGDVARMPVVRHVAFVTRRNGFSQTHRFEALLDSPGKSVVAFAALHHVWAPDTPSLPILAFAK